MFSVIIPLFNKAPYIQRAIDSVLNQSLQDFEIIVVNDGSTDGGEELVKDNYGDQVILFNQTNQGVSAARNRGIAQSKFDFIAFLDADDYWHPEYLFWMNHVLEEFPNAGLLGSSYANEQLPDKILEPTILEITDYFKTAVENTLFTSSSTIIHRDFFTDKVGFKSNLTKGEDIDLWLRAFDWTKKAYYVQAPLMHYDLEASGSVEVIPNLDCTIFTEMFKIEYEIPSDNPCWLVFRDKYLTLNLFQYFDSEANFFKGQNLLKERTNSYPLSQIPYLLPFFFFKFALRDPSLKKLIRNYLKFCFRYIYTQ
ncbi:glycosyltransferase family A protein [Algoriphagus halophytocola]|uniref:glycosyltransferase family 2 protein n=1 Tax=Algoriphagus halophytocola TaxID=2991499 RepID=UPI0022DE7B0B|nr:glycosyltransferase family A protein [Algoriphagus sp. TR-M9]WBL41301.1 glycosyltransferase family A protein [Algoriphagus sp. TR-M9]